MQRALTPPNCPLTSTCMPKHVCSHYMHNTSVKKVTLNVKFQIYSRAIHFSHCYHSRRNQILQELSGYRPTSFLFQYSFSQSHKTNLIFIFRDFCFGNRVFLCSYGHPGTCSVSQASLTQRSSCLCLGHHNRLPIIFLKAGSLSIAPT